MTYKNISVKQLEDIKRLSEQYKENSFVKIARYLLNIDVEQIPITELNKVLSSLQFLNEEIPQVELCDSYTLNGTTYVLDMNPSALSVAQFMDLQNYKDNGASFVDLLSVVLIPDGKKYNIGYDMAKAKEDIGLLPVTDANAIMFFFRNLLIKYAATFQRYFQRLTKKKGKETPTNKALTEQLQAMVSYLLSFVSQK